MLFLGVLVATNLQFDLRRTPSKSLVHVIVYARRHSQDSCSREGREL